MKKWTITNKLNQQKFCVCDERTELGPHQPEWGRDPFIIEEDFQPDLAPVARVAEVQEFISKHEKKEKLTDVEKEKLIIQLAKIVLGK